MGFKIGTMIAFRQTAAKPLLRILMRLSAIKILWFSSKVYCAVKFHKLVHIELRLSFQK